MKTRILLIEDDPALRKLLKEALPESIFNIDIAETGREGLDHIVKRKPDLILLDYSMPAMTDIEVGAVLKAMLPEVPVILFTSQDTRAIESAAISVGIRAVVPKTDIGRLEGHLRRSRNLRQHN